MNPMRMAELGLSPEMMGVVNADSSSMPMVLQYLTLLNSLRYAIDIAHPVYLEGVGLNLVLPGLWPLALIASITLSAASWMFRHRLS